MLIALYMRHFACSNTSHPTSMDLCMVCLCVVIQMALAGFLLIGLLQYDPVIEVRQVPYPVNVIFFTTGLCLFFTVVISMCQWMCVLRERVSVLRERVTPAAAATTAASVIGATNIGTIFVLGRPLGTIDAMMDLPGPVVMGAPVGIDDIGDVN